SAAPYNGTSAPNPRRRRVGGEPKREAIRDETLRAAGVVAGGYASPWNGIAVARRHAVGGGVGDLKPPTARAPRRSRTAASPPPARSPSSTGRSPASASPVCRAAPSRPRSIAAR